MSLRHIIICALAAMSAVSAGAAASAASARLDIISSGDRIFSIMEADVSAITYGDANADGTYSFVTITATDGSTVTFEMSRVARIAYEPATGYEPFAISRVIGEHTSMGMLDCINNEGSIDPTMPYDWVAATSDHICHFLYEPEPGYDAKASVSGDYTGKAYSDADPDFLFIVPAEDYAGWTDSWAFLMPNEPVTITTTATEHTTYVGREFVGTYRGYRLSGKPAMNKPYDLDASYELRANGSYKFNTTDDDAFALHFMYEWDESTNTAAHVEVTQPSWDLSHYYGADGYDLGDGYMYVNIRDYTSAMSADSRYYITALDAFTISAGADPYGKKRLTECINSVTGARKYLFTDDYGIKFKVADVTFRSGSSIGSSCVAIISYDGEAQYRYDYDGSSGSPAITARGAEAGSYTPAGGSGNTLELDGFGQATIGGTTASYTNEGGVITLSNGRVFNIDTSKHTYTEVFANNVWTGAASYSIGNASGAYEGVATNKAVISVTFDKNLFGDPYAGYIAFSIMIDPGDGLGYRSAVSACPKYTYDRSAGTITLPNVLVGTGVGTNSERRTLVLRVSSDLQTMWLDSDVCGDKIYSTGSYKHYVYTGTTNTLHANN